MNFHAGSITTGATTTATIGASTYHQGRGGEVDVTTIWKIPQTMDHHLDEGGTNNNNIYDDEINSSTMMKIYEWYDDMVA